MYNSVIESQSVYPKQMHNYDEVHYGLGGNMPDKILTAQWKFHVIEILGKFSECLTYVWKMQNGD